VTPSGAFSDQPIISEGRIRPGATKGVSAMAKSRDMQKEKKKPKQKKK